jgi:hypothetical protein
VRTFTDEAALEAFIAGPGYENREANGAGKVAFAVVLEQACRAPAHTRGCAGSAECLSRPTVSKE